ncbi:hypothetical protein CEXT_772241 [Caerostris extrusa]|uniref:Uncharacterized protein n=1 Tax=Caerostris extrusa TaxID=172846 RepID=A0AAV4VP87_CAEEX|nr:hypothetical protein CEXT_772241 [Caerostris extrusa]
MSGVEHPIWLLDLICPYFKQARTRRQCNDKSDEIVTNNTDFRASYRKGASSLSISTLLQAKWSSPRSTAYHSELYVSCSDRRFENSPM